MKLKRIALLIALSVIALSSCDNNLKILAPYKDVTVVYGLMDQNDAVHYIRINKAFEGAGNAYSMAQQYDSIYYPVGNIRAYLEDSNLTTNTITDTFNLDTITTIPLPAGTFSYPKQLLYYTTAHNKPLNSADYYKLVVVNTKTGKRVTGSTQLLSDLSFGDSHFATARYFSLSFYTEYPTQIEWLTAPNARIYQLDIRFYYTEVSTSNNDSALKTLDWVFAPLTTPTLAGNEVLTYSITGQGLLSLIKSSIPVNSFVVRKVDSLGLIFTSGTDDLNTYVQLSQPPLGINQDVPSFSDVENGVGLYTARHVQTLNKLIGGNDLIDSLTTESQYVPLNFHK